MESQGQPESSGQLSNQLLAAVYDQFDFVKVDPSPVLGLPLPRTIDEILMDPTWRGLFAGFIDRASGASTAFSQRFARFVELFDGRKYANGTPNEKAEFEKLIGEFDQYHVPFLLKAGQLRKWIHDNQMVAWRQMAVSNLIGEMGTALEAVDKLKGVGDYLKREFNTVATAFESLQEWEGRTDALELIEIPLTGRFSRAEAQLVNAATAAGGNNAGATERENFVAAVTEYAEAAVEVSEAIREFSKTCWEALVDQTHEKLLENFSEEHEDIANAMMALSVSVYILTGIMGALTPTPIGWILGPAALIIGAAYPYLDSFVKNKVVGEVGPEQVQKYLGKRFEGSDAGLAETFGGIAGYVQLAMDTSATAGDIVGDGVVLGRRVAPMLARVGEGTARIVGGAATATGAVVGAAGMSIDLFNSDPKTLEQYLTAEQLDTVQAAVRAAYQVKSQQWFDFSAPVLHGLDMDNQTATVSLGGHRGQLSLQTHAFVPEEETAGFREAIKRMSQEYPNAADWTRAHLVEDLGDRFTVQAPVYYTPADWPECADWYWVNGTVTVDAVCSFPHLPSPFSDMPAGVTDYQGQPSSIFENLDPALALGHILNRLGQQTHPRHPYWTLVNINDTEQGRWVEQKKEESFGLPDDFESWLTDVRVKVGHSEPQPRQHEDERS